MTRQKVYPVCPPSLVSSMLQNGAILGAGECAGGGAAVLGPTPTVL